MPREVEGATPRWDHVSREGKVHVLSGCFGGSEPPGSHGAYEEDVTGDRTQGKCRHHSLSDRAEALTCKSRGRQRKMATRRLCGETEAGTGAPQRP